MMGFERVETLAGGLIAWSEAGRLFGNERSGELVGPSTEFMREKAEFRSSRIRRWFDRDWRTTELTA